VPDARTLALAYPAHYHAYQEQPTRLARLLKRRYWRGKAVRYAGLVGRDAGVLEVGCSRGDLLDALRGQGFTRLTGLEYHPEAAAKAAARGFDVRCGDFMDTGLAGERFRLVSIINFIEHVPDPVAALAKCADLLEPGGCVVGETPNVDAWDHALFGRYWGGYHCPRHLALFGPGSLRRAAERAGLRVLAVRNLLQPAHWALSVQNALQDTRLAPRLKNGRDRMFTAYLLLFAPLNALQLLVSRTSLVEFVLQKPRA
jgi:SAM-dependent methyltransferase